MSKFIFFSKTMYSETPRIRHQLAHLLMSFGHEVVFYQKPLFFFEKDAKLINYKLDQNLQIKQTKQLLHHQLRIAKPLSKLNSVYEYLSIKKSIDRINSNDIIINFNYDYDFLRDIFKKNKIITIINDDFVAQAKFNDGKHVLKYLSSTLNNSNFTLTVSYPLYNQAKQYTNNVGMFLPWALNSYSEPSNSNKRNKILFWGHIDGRIDFKLVQYILNTLKQFEVHFVGPISDKNKVIIDKLKKRYTNLIVTKPTNLDELDLNSYFAAIIPYKANVADIEAVTASNKTFQLLANGLPIITFGMPNFLEHEAIFKCNTYDKFSESLLVAYQKFYDLQPYIESLVNKNQASNRYDNILEIINNN